MSSNADEDLPNNDAGPSSSIPLPSPIGNIDGTSDEYDDHASSDEVEDGEDIPPVRPNRFAGGSSTWHKHTASERGLAASLDQARSNDLSIHLYNAHALKARLRDPVLAAEAKPWQSKQRWIRTGEDGKQPWYPERSWTAWPLNARDVPRKGEEFGNGFDGWGDGGKQEAWKPSQDLEEELLALMLRKGKERFRRRKWESPPEELGNAAANEDEDGEAKTALPTYAHVTPVLLADDEQAKSILQPSIRHIISKLDDLLIGLHKSRAGHRRAYKSRSRSRSKAAASRSRSRSAAPSRRKREVSTDDDDDEVTEASSEDDASAPGPKKTFSGASRRTLGTRDWSEVLGVASLTGWDPAVVDRAAKRCASLFGESMAFRIMPETAAGEARDEVVEYKPEMIPDLESDIEADSDDAERDAGAPRALYCPYEECDRSMEGYEVAWRWREHLKRKHKLSGEQVAEIEEGLRNDEDDEGSGSNSDEDIGRESQLEEDSDSDEEMVGAVHADGFLQPVKAILRESRQRRRRSTAVGEGAAKRQRLEDDENEVAVDGAEDDDG